MKFQVFARSFGGLILLAVLLIIALIYGRPPFQIFVQTVLVISFAVSILLRDVKYVNAFLIQKDKISISYYTPLLKMKSLDCNIFDVKEIKLSKRSSLSIIWPPQLDFKLNGDKYSLEILSKELYFKIQHQVSEGATIRA